ncbi:hypothetical protein F5B20DRAFT_594703 [Whalleya microplaca]|nr:hypothetical protein F5B20DRAFT_594703 [Whalleya microplaca]
MAPVYKREETAPRPFGGEPVFIEFPDGNTTVLSAKVLAHYSEYIREVLNNRPHEGTTPRINLRQHAFDAVSAFVNFCYRPEDKELRTEGGCEQLDTAISCWLLGDYLLAPDFQNCIMQQHLQIRDSANGHDAMITAINTLNERKVRPGSGLYRLLIDFIADHLARSKSEAAPMDYLDLLRPDLINVVRNTPVDWYTGSRSGNGDRNEGDGDSNGGDDFSWEFDGSDYMEDLPEASS